MLVFLILALLPVFFGIRVAKPGQFFPDYLAKTQTAAMGGVFVLLVFLSHASTYVTLQGPLDAAYSAFQGYLRQLVVAPFLFYSGYGMLESIKQKGMDYVRHIPTRRFAKVLLHMEIAVLLFLLTDLAIGRRPGPKKVMLAFTFWESIGNSNWYIFVILSLYLLVFFSFMICRGRLFAGTALTTVLAAGYVYLLVRAGKDMWCTTLALYPLGMWVSLLRPQLEKLVTKHDLCWLVCIGALAVPYHLCRLRSGTHLAWYTLWSALFMALLVLLTMKIKTGNRVLQWLGAHVFSIYILQRIPMMVLRRLGLADHRYLFILLSFLATLALAVLFDAALAKLDARIWRPRSEGKVEPR